MRQTHTYAVLRVSNAAYDEIANALKAAGYSHSFHENSEYGTVIDMHGIALADTLLPSEETTQCRTPSTQAQPPPRPRPSP